MYIKLDFVNKKISEDRYLLYNINGFPPKIVSDIGQFVSVFISKENKLHDFIPIQLNISKNKDEITEGIKETLKENGFMEINPNDLDFFEDLINKILESIEIETSSDNDSEDFGSIEIETSSDT